MDKVLKATFYLSSLATQQCGFILVLLTPNKLLRLKEWVFAGIFFEIIFAFLSKVAVFGFPATIDAIVAFIMVSVTYTMFRMLYPANYVNAIN